MARAVLVWLVAAFLLANLVVRVHALAVWQPRWTASLALVSFVAAGLASAWRPAWLGPVLSLFGGTFLLYGFHSYRPASQAFELGVTVFALVLLARLGRPHGLSVRGGQEASDGPGRVPARAAALGTVVVVLAAAYALLADLSLLLLPPKVLEHRLFLEGIEIGRAVLSAFPKDPLYPIASVNRLWLLFAFAALLALQADARELHRRLFRGVAAAAVLASVLGLLDFVDAISLDRYNLSNLFYGRSYRRLQSTFGNPSWFACFVACALPWVWLELRERRGRARGLLALSFPLLAAAVFLSGARAAWLAVGLVLVAIALALVLASRPEVRAGGQQATWKVDRASWLALAATALTVGVLVVTAWTTPTTLSPEERRTPSSKLEGLSRELQYRGLGVQSPRRVAAAYALALAQLRPVLGLGYETYNLHLRAQLAIPGTAVSKVENTAVAGDPTEIVFDDSHNTYLQVLTGTGVVGLGLWLWLAAAGGLAAGRALRACPSDEAVAVLLSLAVFHLYGLFQGMAYIPVTFLLLPVTLGYALSLEAGADRPVGRARLQPWLTGTVLLLIVAGWAYASDSGYQMLKRRFGVTAYLPDEAAEYEGFYRPETNANGEYRWMRERAIVNARRAAPFRLTFACEHPDADQEPVVLTLRFEGREEKLVFRRQGEAVERRFDLRSPGSLRLSVSRTFQPGAQDKRELGIAVSAIRWE